MNFSIPDAIRSPLNYAGTGDSFMRLSRLQDEFSRVLNVTQIYVRHQGYEHFITGKSVDTLNISSSESQSGGPRYRWEDRGDGVFYGYLHCDR